MVLTIRKVRVFFRISFLSLFRESERKLGRLVLERNWFRMFVSWGLNQYRCQVEARLCRLGSRCVCEEREIRRGIVSLNGTNVLVAFYWYLLGKVQDGRRCLITKNCVNKISTILFFKINFTYKFVRWNDTIFLILSALILNI